MLRDTITAMKVLIFEGIATSGKSTVISGLQKALPNRVVVVAGETETHIPIMQETNGKHIEFFKKLIQKYLAKRPDILIFDRLYLTQAFRAKCSIDNYAEIEKLLSKYSSLTIFLKVDDDVIEDRITKASGHRGLDYFRSRGETLEERRQYYVDQQNYQLELLKHSTLPYRIFNTTTHNYEKITQEIAASIDKE